MKIKARLLFLIVAAVLLTGCPRIAYIEIYNNTLEELVIDSAGQKKTVGPGKSVQLKYTGENFKVNSTSGQWMYQRNVPHSGNDGPYFDGVLRVQINPNMQAFALKVDEVPPISDFSKQPEGYPLDAEK